jgi:hypothetical protein
MQLGIAAIHKELLGKHDFSENQLNDSHTEFKGMSTCSLRIFLLILVKLQMENLHVMRLKNYGFREN